MIVKELELFAMRVFKQENFEEEPWWYQNQTHRVKLHKRDTEGLYQIFDSKTTLT